jgi:glycerol-3-phosphate dehydrogenase (NAD(P)+)
VYFCFSKNKGMQIAILGSGSWATALAKIITDNGHKIYWWMRNRSAIDFIQERRHNPHYLHSTYFNEHLLALSDNMEYVIQQSNVVIVAIPSAYIHDAMSELSTDIFQNKILISAVKGILPEHNELLNMFLNRQFQVPVENYIAISGPCHAEEVAAEKLSYLTLAGVNTTLIKAIQPYFETPYTHVIPNCDLWGVQYAAVLKNIYALGAGIAHGLEYGDNFLSVFIANCGHEMVHFLKKIAHVYPIEKREFLVHYSTSVYLGDLLVTCYSLYSRNRMFGTMIGKKYSVKSAQLELNMVAEGYNAAKCIHQLNKQTQAHIPIIQNVYEILWENKSPAAAFESIEQVLM